MNKVTNPCFLCSSFPCCTTIFIPEKNSTTFNLKNKLNPTEINKNRKRLCKILSVLLKPKKKAEKHDPPKRPIALDNCNLCLNTTCLTKEKKMAKEVHQQQHLQLGSRLSSQFSPSTPLIPFFFLCLDIPLIFSLGLPSFSPWTAVTSSNSSSPCLRIRGSSETMNGLFVSFCFLICFDVVIHLNTCNLVLTVLPE